MRFWSWRKRKGAELQQRGFLSMAERDLFIAKIEYGGVEIVERWEA